ncbi:MAG: DUF1631 domain-containing protein [Alcanivoracaceae bacterium]|nr:DUF1631 domain-containing protein [Alcanivoracaceae bacterium]
MTNKKEKIIHLNKKIQNAENVALGSLLPQIFTKFAKDLKPKLISYFESLDDSLFDLAEKAESNKNQTLYFESMRLIRKSRDRMFADFFNSIKSTFQLFKKNDFDFFNPNSDSNISNETKKLSLSLIDEKELDETLAKINLISKSEMAYHRHIFALKQRFSLLASGTTLEANQIPIGPHVIVNSFTKSIRELDLEVNLKLIMYKLFERNVMGQMNAIYTNINDFLAAKGIIPEIQYNIGRPNQASSGNQALNTPDTTQSTVNQPNNQQPTQGNPAEANNINNQQYIDPNYQLISQLFKQNNPTFNPNKNDINANLDVSSNVTNSSTSANNNVATNVDMGTMMNALSILQSDMFRNVQINEQNSKSPTEIKDELIKQLHKIDSGTKDQRVRQKDEDTIDLVGMLFQFIVEDRNLPDAIQVILAKLQIPYLKIALQDRNLFADKNHPARLLLDNLSLSSVGWTEENDKKKLLINEIEDIVQLILEIEEYDLKIFESLLAKFNVFTVKLKKRSDVVQRRTKEKSLGQDKINQAKEESAKLLVAKMTNKQMPILIRDILLGEWSNVLILMFLRHSQDSKEYLEKVKFVDNVIEYSQQNSDKEINKNTINKLSLLYEKGLKLVAFNSKELINKQHSLVKCLNKIHQLDIDENSKNSPPVELIAPEEILKLSDIRKQKHEIVNYIEEIIEPSKDEEEHENIDDKHAKVISTLKTGTWLEFSRTGNTAVRAKLSWISPITGKYLFVNSRGLKITDKTDLALSAGLRNKTIRVLQQVALFDRALSAIANKLKKDDSPKKEA